jgi:hypothetical protein
MTETFSHFKVWKTPWEHAHNGVPCININCMYSGPPGEKRYEYSKDYPCVACEKPSRHLLPEPTSFTLMCVGKTKGSKRFAVMFNCGSHVMCDCCYDTLQLRRGKDEADPEPVLDHNANAVETEEWENWYDRKTANQEKKWEPVAHKCPKCHPELCSAFSLISK